MISLSVCMIVKNEEDVLARILQCVNKFADEIIIIDTGSSDNTINIAKSFTDKVFNFEWCDDFSKARNYSFSLATKEYIMWVDADDYIDEDNINKILQLKQSATANIDVYMLKYIMGFNGNNHTLEFYRERIIKNNGKFFWEGFVHEVITPSGNIQYLDISIKHKKEKIGNPKRNLQLYNNALKNNTPFSPRDQYYYSRELYYNNYLTKAETQLKKYLKMNDTYTPNILGAYEIRSTIHLLKNQVNKGKKCILKCIEKYTPTPQLIINLAKLYELENNIQNAIYFYHSIPTIPRTTSGFINPDAYAFIPYMELTRLYYKIGNYEIAKTYHNLAKKIHPNHPSVIYNEQYFK